MRKYILLLLLGSLLCGCWAEQTPLSFDSIVKIAEVKPLNYYQKHFTGSVASTQNANLAFAVSGLIDAMYVSEGDNVSKGQLLATLDDDDYKWQVESSQASFNTAQSIMDRAVRLHQRDAVSSQELELAQEGYMQARTNYMYAMNRLSDTQLKAPFSGSIEKQYADTFQEISASTVIYRLINPSSLEVKFTLPESDANMLLVPLEFFVEFDNLPQREFSASMKNFIDGSIASAGIPITLDISDKNFSPSRFNIKVGFSCKVVVQLSDNKNFKDFTVVPISSLMDSHKVWVYNSKTSSVSLRHVEVSSLTGKDQVIISKGLKEGESVVVAGIYSLVEGQKVRVLK